MTFWRQATPTFGALVAQSLSADLTDGMNIPGGAEHSTHLDMK